jgi:hypothetical protein
VSESLRAILELNVSILLTFLFVICLSASNLYGVFCGREVPSQVVYQTNADWYASYEALVNNSLMKADTTQKGLLQFWFKDNPTLFTLSPTGKLQVKWHSLDEKRTLYKLLRNLLVPNSNGKLVIKPLRQQVWIEYPVPESFKLYWCDNASEYVLNKSRGRIVEARELCTHDRAFCPVVEEVCVSDDGEGLEEKKMLNPLALVGRALDELRREFRFFREPTLKEVVLKSGCADMGYLKSGLRFGHWIERSYQDAKRIGEQAINLAGLLKFQEGGELNPQVASFTRDALETASLDSVLRAQIILKNCPDLVPQVVGNELRWPEETKKAWIRVFGCEPPAAKSWRP